MVKKNKLNPWLSCPRPKPEAKVRLFCFPYAGGNASIFSSWDKSLPDEVEVYLINLPGRGLRLTEPPFTQMPLLVESIAEVLVPFCDKPFATFGHSMGATVSFEIVRLLRRKHGVSPVALFVSGRRAPHIFDPDPPRHLLPDAELIEELRSIKGTVEELLNDHELLQLVLPAIRADFEICYTYQYVPGEPLNCPVIAFGGLDDDEESAEKLEAWQEVTTGSFSLKMFPGDHFFLHTSEPLLLETISRELQQILRNLP